MSDETNALHGMSLDASYTVNDLEKSLAWYCDVVGFAVDQKHEREGKVVAVSLRAGKVRILLAQDDGAKGWDRVKGDGCSVQITTDGDMTALAEGIKARGGTLETELTDTPWGVRIFRLRDPDGFRFTVTTPRPTPPS
jgi:uncharacterized glyoxalase superfamily protein PhnB